MTFRVGILDEPLLEFGGNGREIDIRLGLMRHGPLEPERAGKVRLGIIGTAETTEGFARFLDRCKVGLDAKESRQPNLFLPFPGLGNDNPFRCSFELDPHARKPIPRADIARIAAITSTPKAVVEAVELFAAQAQAIAEAPAPPDVILCALPTELITRVVHETIIPDHDQDDEENDDDTTRYDFHDLLKAKRRFHALRHAIAVHLLDAGADVAFVQDRLGHANIQNTMVYMRYTTVTRDAQTRQLFASHRVV